MKNNRAMPCMLGLLLCAAALQAKEPTLEENIADAARRLGDAIDGKVQTVAVLDIRSEHWALSDYIVNKLNHKLTTVLTETNVAERDEYSLALIQKESDYQLSGAVSDETIQEISAALGADCIILGNMETVSGGWELTLRASTVESKRVLSSWQGKVGNKEKEVKFQMDKSKKPRPVYKLPQSRVSSGTGAAGSSPVLTVSAAMINEDGEAVTVLHPKDVIRFQVSVDKNAYLAILCIDAKKNEEWLPIQDNYIRAGESRIFPDIPGAVLRVQSGTYGAEQVKIYASATQGGLPSQGRTMGTRAFSLESEGSTAEEYTIDYKVAR